MKEDIMLGFLVLAVFVVLAYVMKKVGAKTQSVTV